jgi:hypothetical protein|tara:strand:+ start:65 stop:232 length:168 start_codon:yes stop_codon:yes gene_type:complete
MSRLRKVHLTRTGVPKVSNPTVASSEAYINALLKESLKEGETLFHDGGSVKTKVY